MALTSTVNAIFLYQFLILNLRYCEQKMINL